MERTLLMLQCCAMLQFFSQKTYTVYAIYALHALVLHRSYSSVRFCLTYKFVIKSLLFYFLFFFWSHNKYNWYVYWFCIEILTLQFYKKLFFKFSHGQIIKSQKISFKNSISKPKMEYHDIAMKQGMRPESSYELMDITIRVSYVPSCSLKTYNKKAKLLNSTSNTT